MNSFVFVPLTLVFLLFFMPYVYRRESGSILFPRFVLAALCALFLLHFAFSHAEFFFGQGEYAEWIAVFALAIELITFNIFFSWVVNKISNEIEERERAKINGIAASKAEEIAKRLVDSRDNAEFGRLRSEALKALVGSDFEQRLQQAVNSEAYHAEQKRLQKRTEGDDLNQAIWVGLHGADKVLGYEVASDEVLAIPYWVHYQLDKSPRVTRFNWTLAQVKKVHDISFMAKRWSKVEDQAAVVVDGALVYPPAMR